MKATKSAFGLMVCCLFLTACRHVEEERLFADARINDIPVRLAYDTGSESTLIFKKTANRLHVKSSGPGPGKPAPGKVMIGQSEFCQFKMGSEEYRLKLATLKLPWWWGGLGVDGVIGWPDMMDEVIEIDATTDSIKGLEALPEKTAEWRKAPLYKKTGVLALQLPRADGKPGVVEVDTGNSEGVSLSPARWKEWRAAHPHAHWRWTLHLMPGSGAILGRKYTADELTLGPIVLTNVPIRKANRTEMGIAGDAGVFEASIGLRALEQMEFIVDQKNQLAYMQSRPVLVRTNEHRTQAASGETRAWTNSSHVKLRFRQIESFFNTIETIKAGKPDATIASCARYLEFEPTNAWILACCGEARYKANLDEGNGVNFDKAMSDLSGALQLDPSIAPAYLVRGCAQYMTRKWEEALKDFRHFCTLDTHYVSYPRIYIWMIRNENGEKLAADEELAAFFEKSKNKDIGEWQARIASFLLGRLSEEDFLHSGMDVAKRDGGLQCEAWFYAGWKRRLAGDRARAREYFQKSVATQKKNSYEYGFAAAELRTINDKKSKEGRERD